MNMNICSEASWLVLPLTFGRRSWVCMNSCGFIWRFERSSALLLHVHSQKVHWTWTALSILPSYRNEHVFLHSAINLTIESELLSVEWRNEVGWCKQFREPSMSQQSRRAGCEGSLWRGSCQCSSEVEWWCFCLRLEPGAGVAGAGLPDALRLEFHNQWDKNKLAVVTRVPGRGLM